MYSYFVIFFYLIILLSANKAFWFLTRVPLEGAKFVFNLLTPLTCNLLLLIDLICLSLDVVFLC